MIFLITHSAGFFTVLKVCCGTLSLDSSENLPEHISINGFKIEKIDQHSFEVEVERGQSMNEVFSNLSAQGISIISMRNKANRLEEMFVSMIAQSSKNNSEGL